MANSISITLKVLTILAAGLAPAMLLAGYSYHVMYLSAFDVDVMLLPMALADNLGMAWYVGVLLFSKLVSSMWMVLGYALLALFWLLFSMISLIWVYHKGWLPGLFTEHDENNPGPTFMSVELYRWKGLGNEIYKLIDKGLGVFLVVFFVFLVIPLFLIITPAKKGAEEGERQRKLVETVNHDCALMRKENLKCIEISRSDSSESYVGLFVTGTDRFVALFNADGITVLERDSGDKIRIRSHQNKEVAEL